MSQTFHVDEINQNNGKDGRPVWLIVKGSVYDVTNFIKDHPGGEDIVLEYSGKDATKAFNEAGHSTDAIKELKAHKIGVVANETTEANAPITIAPSTTALTTHMKQPPNNTSYRMNLVCPKGESK